MKQLSLINLFSLAALVLILAVLISEQGRRRPNIIRDYQTMQALA